VVSPHHLASEAGLSILRAGGNAIDAAIATNAALSVVASNMCGLGGDAFWLIWNGGELHALNGSGRSAGSATPEAARAAGLDAIPLRGPWSVTVPGAVRSWGDAHSRFGRLAWSDLLEPAVELADGFPATPRWSESVERSAALFGARSDWAAVFRAPRRAWRAGERVVLAAVARTLRRLAAEGPADFYGGQLARRSAQYLLEQGSPLRFPDLEEHRSDWAEPIRITYRGVTATSHPPNSSGAIALEMLNVLQQLDPPSGRLPQDDPGWIHAGLEAARLTLADRDSSLTDPEAMPRGALETLLDPRHAAELARRIDQRRATPASPSPLPAGGGTVYLATADRWGGVVSLIESNYAGFGSGLVDPETGIAFQNRGAFFTLDPRDANVLAPRKRTMHTLAPGMLFRDGRPWIAHGAMGGEIQPQIFAQFVSAVVDSGMDIATAVAAPRWAAEPEEHYGPPSRTVLERRFPESVAHDLGARGHKVEWTEAYSGSMGHAHAIELVGSSAEAGGDAGESDGQGLAGWLSFVAATDPRSDGLPATF
jgi:gamma-glutamyltranspeptidase/glutathione hydrolase